MYECRDECIPIERIVPAHACSDRALNLSRTRALRWGPLPENSDPLLAIAAAEGEGLPAKACAGQTTFSPERFPVGDIPIAAPQKALASPDEAIGP
jgi:hypothetical protein